MVDYQAAKLRALTILDSETEADLLAGYSTKYNAKTQLYQHLGISSSRMAVLAPDVSKDLKKFKASSKSLTGSALSGCKAVGDFITKYCGAAGIALDPGEPK